MQCSGRCPALLRLRKRDQTGDIHGASSGLWFLEMLNTSDSRYNHYGEDFLIHRKCGQESFAKPQAEG
jgi:hypothetical protein